MLKRDKRSSLFACLSMRLIEVDAEGQDQRASAPLVHPLEGPRKDFSITQIRQARCLLAIILMPRGAPAGSEMIASGVECVLMSPYLRDD